MRRQLEEVRAWAQEKIASGAEPPWAWFQYMKLIETADAILAGQAVVTTESSPQPERQPGVRLQLVGAMHQQDAAQRHQVERVAPLPM